MLIFAVVGEDRSAGTNAVLLKPALAVCAGAARVNKATDGGKITDFESRNLRADARDAAEDFVARYHGIVREPPFIPRKVQIAVADPAVHDVDLHIGRRGLTACDRCWSKWRGRRLRSVGFGRHRSAPFG